MFFFYIDTPTTEIYTLSLHDALPIFGRRRIDTHILALQALGARLEAGRDSYRLTASRLHGAEILLDRKSTRLNSSHVEISYAVFCLKKKKTKPQQLYDYQG